MAGGHARGTAFGVVLLLLLVGPAGLAAAQEVGGEPIEGVGVGAGVGAGSDPDAGGPSATLDPATQGAPVQDGVPETWVLNDEVIEGEERDLAERIRVFPGARLRVVDSTLRFASHAGGLTGIVAEAGGWVEVVDSRIETAPGSAPGGFLVHLEGHTLLERATIDGAARVVVQPRSLTDLVDDLAGADLESQVPGWRFVRTFTNSSARLVDAVIHASPGPALAVGVPEQYDGDLPDLRPAVTIRGGEARATDAPALQCFVTRQDPDPDDGTEVPILAEEVVTSLRLDGVALASQSGPVVHCPPAPEAFAAPARNVPVVDPAVAAPVNALLPMPPSPEAVPGPATLTLVGGVLTGAGANQGILADSASTALTVQGVHFESLSAAVVADAAGASAALTDLTGEALGDGIVARAGTITATGGRLAGSGATGTAGVRAEGASVSLTGTALEGFATGIAATADFSFTGGTLEGMPVCAALAGTSGVGTLRQSTLRACGTGVVLDAATRATVRDNVFLTNGNPLLVASPDPEGTPAHFDHTVTGNTVHGKMLRYYFQAAGVDSNAATGHAVVAHSSDVRIGQLDLTHGGVQVVASTEVVLGAPTDLQADLLGALQPALVAPFEEVHRGVQFAIYPGSLKGPDGAAAQGKANDLDQAWLLVDELRALGQEARFVDGTAFLTEDVYKAWVGMDHTQQAVSMWGWSGRWYGATMDMDRTWVEVQVAPGVWVELDPAFEAYDWHEPSDELDQFVGWNDFSQYEAYVDTITFGEHGIRNPDMQMVVDEVQAGTDAALQWMRDNPQLTGLDVAGGRTVRTVAASEEPLRTPQSRYDAVPLDEQWSVRITSFDWEGDQATQGEIDFTGTTPLLYGKAITLQSVPADDGEWAELDAAGGIYDIDRHSLRMSTYLFVDGEPQDRDGKWATGPSSYEVRATPSNTRELGELLGVAIDIQQPGGQVVVRHDSPVRVGGAYSVVLDIGATTPAEAAEAARAYDETVQRAMAGEAVDRTAMVGQLHRMDGLAYFSQVNIAGEGIAMQSGLVEQPLVDAAVTGQSLTPIAVWDGSKWVHRVEPTPPYIDVQSLTNAYPKDGDGSKRFGYYFGSGIHSSLWEDHIFTQLHSLPSVSTIKILNNATAEGQWIHQVNQSNVNQVLATTDLPQAVEDSIRNAVANGKWAIVHDSEVTYFSWTGVGWIEFDPDTGAAGWLIYGGADPPTGTSLAEPVILNGGSGATWIPWNDHPPNGWDHAYDDHNTLKWTKDGAGAVLTMVENMPVLVTTETAIQYQRDIFYAQFRYGGQTFIHFEDNTRVLVRVTQTVDDPVGGAARGIAKGAGFAFTVLESGLEAHSIYTNPADTRSFGEKSLEVGGRTAYNFAAGAVAGKAAAVAAVHAGAVCALAAGVGAIVCGGIGAIGAAVGVGLASGWLKGKLFS